MSTAVISRAIFTCPGRAGPVFRLDRHKRICCHREAARCLVSVCSEGLSAIFSVARTDQRRFKF